MPFAVSKSLILRRIPRKYTEDDLKTLFTNFFGDVRDVYCPVDKFTGRKSTYAFIEFISLENAMECFKQINGTPGMLLDGVILRVDFAKNGRKTPIDMMVKSD